jgi:hypothetical protein
MRPRPHTSARARASVCSTQSVLLATEFANRGGFGVVDTMPRRRQGAQVREDRLQIVVAQVAWGKAAGLTASALKGLLRDETDSMVNQVYGAMDIEAKRAAMEQVHSYVKRTAAAAIAAKEGPKTVQ